MVAGARLDGFEWHESCTTLLASGGGQGRSLRGRGHVFAAARFSELPGAGGAFADMVAVV